MVITPPGDEILNISAPVPPVCSYAVVSPESTSVVVTVATVVPMAEFSSIADADNAISVGASLTSLIVIVNSSVYVAPAESVTFISYVYDAAAS